MKLSRKQFIAACAAIAVPTESIASLLVIKRQSPLPDPPHAEWFNCDCDECEEWEAALHEHVEASVKRALVNFWRVIQAEYSPLLKGTLPKYADSGVEETLRDAVEDWISGALEDKPLPQRPNWCPVGLDHQHRWFDAKYGICPLCNQKI